MDASWASEKGTGRKSRSGIAILYGQSLVFWKSSLQTCIATSSTESEYIALADAAKIIAWFRSILIEMGIPRSLTKNFEDNSGVIAWCHDNTGNEFSKKRHMDLKFHYVQDLIEKGFIQIVKESSTSQTADFLTKLLSPNTFLNAKNAVGLVSHESEEGC